MHEISISSPAQVWKCSECGKEFKSSFKLWGHKNKIINCPTGIHFENVKVCKCDFCGKKFSSPSDLKKHYVVHTGEKPYECEICQKRFTQKSNLVRHMKIHETGMPSPVEIHKSSECGKEYRSSPALDKHEKSHFGNTKILKCDLSDKIHSGKAHHKQHIHTREKRYECEICQKQYNYKSALVTHMKIHITGITSPIEIHKCSECGKEYRTSSALGKHKKTHFGNAKIYKCDLCGTTFAESSRLEQHYLIHTGEKPSQCEICMK